MEQVKLGSLYIEYDGSVDMDAARLPKRGLLERPV
jgi:hypothetical protein